VLHLRTFGTLGLHASEGASVGSLLAQPRSMALLAYLVVARPRGYLRRDTLCALFWPDADDEHARGALSQALTRIRRSVGDHVLELRGKNEVRVVHDAIACDVLAFDDALAAGTPAAALDLYAGPFLCGFHVPSAPDFERWTDAERDRLRSLAAGAARAVVREHMAGRRLEEARRVAVRALELAPESEAAACELVRELRAAGDRVGALSLYNAWAAALARDLELEPSNDACALARELQSSSPPATSVLPAPPATPVTPALPALATAGEEAVGEAVSAGASSGAVASGFAGRLLRRRAAGATAAGVLLILAGWSLMHAGFLAAGFPVEASGRSEAGLAPHDWLVVAEFEAPSGDPALALAFQTLLIRDLESSGYASVVGGLGALSRHGLGEALVRMRLPADTRVDAGLACELAEREGAAGVLAGRVLRLGDDYVLTTSILGVADCEERIRASTVAPFDQLAAAVAAVSAELRARLGESRASIRGSPPLPPLTVGLMAAMRALLHYQSTPELWDDEARGAAPLLEAIRLEPDFAMAHFLLAIHYERLGRHALAVPHILRAYEVRTELPRPGRLGMEALHDRYLASDPLAAMATAETILAELPGAADAAVPFLADVALWLGDWERALDVSLDHLRRNPAGLGARLTVARACAAAWALGRWALADSLHQLLIRPAGDDPLPPDRGVVLLHHLRHRDWDGAETFCASQPGWDRCGYLHLARGRLATAEASLGPALAGNGRQPWDRAAATAALSHIERLRGRPDRAWELLRQADIALPMTGPARAGMHLNRFLFCSAAVALGRSGELPECDIEREDPAEWDADPSFSVVLRSGAWSYRLLALRALERGDAATALQRAGAAVASNFGNPVMVDHLIHALAFDALDRPDSARARYREAARIERDGAFPTAAAIAFPMASVHRRIGELSEDLNDPAAALDAYGAFVDLWADADPELQPRVRAARERMRALTGERSGLPRRGQGAALPFAAR
jgi:DNA-binding SARP family transcriptional activator